MPTPFSHSYLGAWTFRRPDGTFISSGTTPTGVRAVQLVSGVKRRKPKGWIPPTGYTFSFTQYQRAVGVAKQLPRPGNSSPGSICTGCVGGDANRDTVTLQFDNMIIDSFIGDDTLANRALIKARNQLKSTDVNLGVAFAERKATARLLGDTAFNIGKSFNHLRRGRVRAAMNQLGITSRSREPRGSNVPRKWLELQYGWKPALSDVFGACEALSKRPKGDWTVTAKGSATSERKITKTWSAAIAGNGWVDISNGAFVRIDAVPSNEALISLVSLGVTNPLLIGWELVPFSFVVDWALPIGGWLESLDALLGYATAYTSTSVLSRGSWHVYGGKAQDASWTYDNQYYGGKRVVRLARVVSNNVPLPRFPRIKDPASLGHMANGLALLASAFGRR